MIDLQEVLDVVAVHVLQVETDSPDADQEYAGACPVKRERTFGNVCM